MILYHGTDYRSALDINSKGILLKKGDTNTDFAQGFYTSEQIDSAIRWALTRGMAKRCKPIVISIKAPNNWKALVNSPKDFPVPDLQWAQFIANNRCGDEYVAVMPSEKQDNNLSFEYDICKGRIADGGVRHLCNMLRDHPRPITMKDVEDFIQGDYPVQYSFHTEAAIKLLGNTATFWYYEIRKGVLKRVEL